MKTNNRIIKWLALLALAILNSQLSTTLAAVTFTNTPSTISNTYAGNITLQINGLTNGETVVFQEFIDANTNGVIDAGDMLVQQFQLTDGQPGMVIGGVTNPVVPGDTTPRDGAITAQIVVQPQAFWECLVAKYLYKLSSPSGRFAPITNLFTVTNSTFAQSFNGNVVCSGTNVPNAVVMVFTPQNVSFKPVAGTVANNSGSYTIKTPPGTYMLWAMRSNYLADLNVAPVLTLAGNTTITTNLTLLAANQSISGRFVDASNSNLGLPGASLGFMSTNNLAAMGFSDTNGNFTVGVASNIWKLGSVRASFDYLGYPTLESKLSVDTTTGSVAGLTIALPKGTALIYGTITNQQGQPMPGAAFGDANNGTYRGDETADQNGNYFMAVTAGTWSGSIDADYSGYDDYNFSPNGFNVAITNGQALRIDFVASPVPPPVLSQPARLSSTQFGFSLSASSGHNYTVLATTNVSTPLSNWFTVLVTNISGSPVSIQDNQATNQQRFYDVMVGP